MPSEPLLLGHRGARASRSIPENTIESFDHALADGCDGFEFDLRVSADRQAVVCHDPKVGRIEVATATTEQLRDLPRLQDVLQRYQASAFLDIELKVPGLEEIAIALLAKHPPRRGFVVSSFLPDVLRTIHSLDSSIPLGLICETKAQLAIWRQLPVAYVVAHQKLVDRDLVQQVNDAQREMLVWTVNRLPQMRRFAGMGVKGIISDDTRLLSTVRA
jgi:glycerophosphoryl diester phosphodiesterase